MMNQNIFITPSAVTRNFQWRPPVHCHTAGPWGKRSFNQNGSPRGNYGNGNEEHWCETCDRGFPTFELLEKHKGQHQKCNIDGCQFIAHPKVITRHIQMQHSSGLYKKIAKLDSPEEIQKWREERKKKYPTKSTIDKKAAQIKEKIDRGEKMGLRYTQARRNNNLTGIENKRKHESMNHNQKNQNKIDFKRKKPFTHSPQNPNAVRSIKPKVPQRTPKALPLMEVKRKLQPFSGIQNIIAENYIECDTHSLPDNDPIEDFDEALDIDTDKPSDIKPGVCGALTLLMCDYGSSDEDNDNKANVECITTESKSTNIQRALNPLLVIKNIEEIAKSASVKSELKLLEQNISHNTDSKNDDDSGPEEIKTTKIDENEINRIEENMSQKADKPEKKLIHRRVDRSHLFRRPKPKLPSTLLTKLLRKEMQQERNIVLQCIRHIVKSNYFKDNKVDLCN